MARTSEKLENDLIGLRATFFYDEAFGRLWRKTKAGNYRPCALSKEKGRYTRIWYKSRTYAYHHIVWLMFNDSLPEQIDHIDRNKKNNRIENLRPSTHQQNMFNKGVRKDSRSRIKGITKNKDSWRYSARIFRDGKLQYLGTFCSKEEAQDAYDKAARELHGEFFYKAQEEI